MLRATTSNFSLPFRVQFIICFCCIPHTFDTVRSGLTGRLSPGSVAITQRDHKFVKKIKQNTIKCLVVTEGLFTLTMKANLNYIYIYRV